MPGSLFFKISSLSKVLGVGLIVGLLTLATYEANRPQRILTRAENPQVSCQITAPATAQINTPISFFIEGSTNPAANVISSSWLVFDAEVKGGDYKSEDYSQHPVDSFSQSYNYTYLSEGTHTAALIVVWKNPRAAGGMEVLRCDEKQITVTANPPPTNTPTPTPVCRVNPSLWELQPFRPRRQCWESGSPGGNPPCSPDNPCPRFAAACRSGTGSDFGDCLSGDCDWVQECGYSSYGSQDKCSDNGFTGIQAKCTQGAKIEFFKNNESLGVYDCQGDNSFVKVQTAFIYNQTYTFSARVFDPTNRASCSFNSEIINQKGCQCGRWGGNVPPTPTPAPTNLPSATPTPPPSPVVPPGGSEPIECLNQPCTGAPGQGSCCNRALCTALPGGYFCQAAPTPTPTPKPCNDTRGQFCSPEPCGGASNTGQGACSNPYTPYCCRTNVAPSLIPSATPTPLPTTPPVASCRNTIAGTAVFRNVPPEGKYWQLVTIVYPQTSQYLKPPASVLNYSFTGLASREWEHLARVVEWFPATESWGVVYQKILGTYKPPLNQCGLYHEITYTPPARDDDFVDEVLSRYNVCSNLQNQIRSCGVVILPPGMGGGGGCPLSIERKDRVAVHEFIHFWQKSFSEQQIDSFVQAAVDYFRQHGIAQYYRQFFPSDCRNFNNFPANCISRVDWRELHAYIGDDLTEGGSALLSALWDYYDGFFCGSLSSTQTASSQNFTSQGSEPLTSHINPPPALILMQIAKKRGFLPTETSAYLIGSVYTVLEGKKGAVVEPVNTRAQDNILVKAVRQEGGGTFETTTDFYGAFFLKLPAQASGTFYRFSFTDQKGNTIYPDITAFVYPSKYYLLSAPSGLAEMLGVHHAEIDRLAVFQTQPDNSITTQTVKPTDINHDGVVNMMDVSLILNSYGAVSGESQYDLRVDFCGASGLQSDGKVNAYEISCLVRDLMQGWQVVK